MKWAEGAPGLENTNRKCLCLYYYFIDPDVGLFPVRIQTGFPFTIQFCVNGHEWWKKRLQKQGVDFPSQGNCFTAIADLERFHDLADGFVCYPWVEGLSTYARKVNPFLQELLSPRQYYWICDQAEYVTNGIFTGADELEPL